MKKVLILISILLLSIALVACGGTNNNNNNENKVMDNNDNIMNNSNDDMSDNKDNDKMNDNNEMNNNDNNSGDSGSGTDMISLTLEELAEFDGTGDKPAYIAYKGKVYDVSDHPQWTNGSHGGNTAGTDLTEKLGSAPHGDEIIEKEGLEQVGVIVE